MEEITKKQQKLLDFIEEYQFENGKSPTFAEMRTHMKVVSDNAILKHLIGLEKKGFIEKDDTPRGIKLLGKVKAHLQMAGDMESIPLLGTIPAGGPVITEENVIETYEIGKGLMSTGSGSFLLRVTGSSMINAGIHEGDMVLVNPDQTARNSDIIVALIDGENTVKRYMNEKGKIYLKAENPEYEDIYPHTELQIQGVVTGLIRSY